ncbi:bifunctional RecB family nuclease/DEAD/DEAH box helicase [Nocardia jejuensis]|uniref:bifunctional RecB family nuclease/DEAD/DEAH box helicase n=1 Tax=Nocardia jejuensis TaxID=328049 RepID=UPI00247FF465|nr:bifunctional RecB family nuclease/DEAD/DEAH box helicase [Nocardia jejuensis]
MCSTRDLVAAARCEFAVLRALDAELGLVTPIDVASTGALSPARERTAPARAMAAQAGPATTHVMGSMIEPGDRAFEHRLADLRDRYGSGVARVRGLVSREHDSHDEPLAALRAAHDHTLAALRANADAVAGAVVFDGEFAAHCDFLIRDSSPEAHDYLPAAVATRRTTVTALLTLVACADALHRIGFRPAPHARIWVDGVATTHSLADIAVVHRARRARLDHILEAKLGELLPVQWDDRRFLACGHCPSCTAELETHRDLRLVAGMRATTRAQLRDAGIATVERLAAADVSVTGIPAPAFTVLRRQAELQLQRESTDRPAHTLVDAPALAALPQPSRGDLFVSVTADPGATATLFRSADPTPNLTVSVCFLDSEQRTATTGHADSESAHAVSELLVGASAASGSGEHAHSPWIESAGGTGVMEDFEPSPGSGAGALALGFEPVAAASYSSKAVRSFIIRATQYDDAEALLDFLAERQRLCPDLRIHHYRGNLRPVLSALGERQCDDEDLVAELLPALVDLYPVVRAALIVGERSYDLHRLPPNQGESGGGAEAILRLRDWLLDVAAEYGVRPDRRWAYDYAETGPDEIEAALREFADAAGQDRSPAQTAAAFTAAALGYHRRERQPKRWAHDDRLDHPVEDWADTPGVLLADWGSVDTQWHSTGQRPMRRYLTLTGRLGTGNAPKPGTRVLTLYDRPAPGMSTLPGRRSTAHATVLGCSLDTNFEDVVRVVELLPEGCEPYDQLPTAIAPCPPSRQAHLEEAIEDIAHQLLVSLPEVPETAVFDLLCRRPPRLRTWAALPEVFGDHAAAVTAAVLDLDNSYMAVQGPPGTGKTDTTARVVERLVTRYRWRVGVVARSHAVVEHVLDAVVEVGVLPELVAKSDAQSVASEWLPIEAIRYPRFLDNAVNGCVVGGLPADFADAERIAPNSLDLLVIADAGKFPLAEAVAVAVCARNVLLVGDPAPATGEGAHPEPIGDSALGRIVGPHRTLPATHGYFLDRTWRMHPRMSGPVSRLRYENRLRSNETVTLARELDGVRPGVHTVAVEHHGNTTESAEEAREIVRQVRTLLGLPWHTGAVTRRLHPHDILVVAPYHAQVARIRTLLSRARIEDVLVGTPDHFRGREAAVVLVSMTTSAPQDAPHGIGALLSRHWLTSAISRAMWSAIIVRSPLLTEYLPATTAELSDLAAALQLDRV